MTVRDLVEAGIDSLERGEWAAARDAFQAACSADPTGDALDGLGRALWWLDEPELALELRARAFARLRQDRRDADAAWVAIWLAREHRARYRRCELAVGWLARARSLVSGLEGVTSLAGWLLIAELEARAPHPAGVIEAEEVLRIARAHDDRDLEIIALMRRGACAVSGGDVRRGLSDVHEAMAAATSGEGRDVQFVAEALCSLLEVADVLGDTGIVGSWIEVLVSHRSTYQFGPLLPLRSGPATDLISAFCTACCGGVYLVTGRLDAAEEQLARAAQQMSATGLRPRCLHPVADLVRLRLVQGRVEEAEVLLDGFEDDPECAHAAALVDLALDRPLRAVERLRAALAALAESPVPTLPLWSELVTAALAAHDVELAEKAAVQVADIAEMTGTVLHAAHRDHGLGLVAAATARPDATALLEAAARGFAAAGAALLACRARLALARSLVTTERGRAVTEARSALQAFDRMGATADADRTAAFLRELGIRGRTGPRGIGTLSRREHQVLGLVAEGLSNAEIAERLFISSKTAGHHVSNILLKLGVRSRTEATAYALLHLPKEPRSQAMLHP